MDLIDRNILALLQIDGRISLTRLASEVGLSLSACQRRVRQLELEKVITGYRAIVAPELLDLGFEAVVFVYMKDSDSSTVTQFELALEDIPNLVTVERLFGEPDYLMRVVATDMDHYQEIYDNQLSALPGVQRVRSTVVMKKLGDGVIPTA